MGVVLGALIAATSTWLNSILQSRREKAKEDRDVRRQAYVDYLHCGQVFSTAIGVFADELFAVGKPDESLRRQAFKEVRTASFEFRRAAAAVDMAADAEIARLTGAAEQALLDFVTDLHDFWSEISEASDEQINAANRRFKQQQEDASTASEELTDAMRRDLRL